MVEVTGSFIRFTCGGGCCVDLYSNEAWTTPMEVYRGPITREVIDMAVDEIQKMMVHLTIHALNLKETQGAIQPTNTEENSDAHS